MPDHKCFIETVDSEGDIEPCNQPTTRIVTVFDEYGILDQHPICDQHIKEHHDA